ncbi:protocadherin gamma-A4-like [Empidonax traillii]|uniref:protocadherin gamma-A4-like n=1 Tax=Empidonax traillii TaxID=164674 RepID=UPI000FFD50CA|nr:protocadherin gamma-A4-like [Empidonax traillii]
MCSAGRRWGRRQRVLLWGVLLAAWEAAWGQLHYSVPEEMPKGSFVGDVAKDLGLQLPALSDRGVRLFDKGRTQYFALHGKTGHLVTTERIDREQLCRLVEKCVLRCELIVEGEMKVYGIEVEVKDINDNAPSFGEAETELRMSETTAPGSRFPLARAHDPDSGQNSLQSYELSGDEHFSLAVQTGPGGDQRPELVLAKALDREEAAFHELVLRAMDGGDPARTGTVRIRVTVLDANDNAPVFSQAEYTVRVAEDVPVGSILVTVSATDPDEGMNGQVKYSMKKEKNMASDIFHLDAETGAITLLRNLDFEEGDFYELEVQAHDGGGLFDTTKVAISVTDVNDNAPELRVSSALSEISEDAPSGTVVALLHVHDHDSGANGEVRCSLEESVPFLLEKSLEGYYRVVTARELDREQQSEYNVTVRASDGGWPALQSSRVLALRVLDVNDNAPVFSQERYSARLRCSPRLSSKAAAVLRRRLRVSLLAAAERRWSRSRRRRSVLPPQAARSPGQWRPERQRHGQQRREAGTLPYSYNLCVAAPARAAAEAAWPPPPLPILPAEELLAGEPCDKPSPSSSAVAGEPPTDPDTPKFPVGEAGRASLDSARCLQCREEAAGAAVDREEREEGRSAAAPPAADRLDCWINWISGSGSGRFPIIRAVRSRDTGRQRVRRQRQKACCGAGGAAAEMCSAGRRWGRRQRVLLWGVLLAAWEAAWGQLRYSVNEEMPKGSFVGDVAKDLGLQIPALSDLGVHVVSEGKTQYFTLHGKTGHLVTAERIDREQLCRLVEKCVLRCELIVEGEMQVYGIEVEIMDINDNAPSFKEIELEQRISETMAPGSRFPLVEAHDPDSGRNSLQSYELSGDEHFSLAVQTGPAGDQRPELVLAKALDREEVAFHELVLRAMDGGDPSRTGTARIRVTVLDANDNAPVFSQAEYTVRVPEDVPVGSVLVTVSATDADEGMNGDVKYLIKKATDRALQTFQLDVKKGAIMLVRSLDFEEDSYYELEVQAHDGGGLSDAAKIGITVTDINDNMPEISLRSALSEISEDAPSGTVVALLHVHDQDSGANGEVRCSLDGDVPFQLEKSYEDYYRMVTARDLDREQQSEYNVTVRASDGGWPALQSSRVLALRVLDVNDNAPVFSQERYSARLRENNAAGALQQQLLATAGAALRGVPATHFVGIDGVRAFLHSYSHDVSLTADSRKSHLRFSAASCCDTLPARPPPDEPAPLLGDEDLACPQNADPTPPPLSERAAGAEAPAELQFYLVLALALLSALFVLSVALAVLARLRRAGPPAVLRCLGAQRFSLAGAAFPPDFCEGTLPYSYNLCVAAPARAAAEAAWPPPPLPILPAEELLAGEPCEKPSPSSSAVAGEPPTDPDAPQVCKPLHSSLNFSECDICLSVLWARQGGHLSAALGACSAGRRLRAPLLTERSERKVGALQPRPLRTGWIAGFLVRIALGFQSSLQCGAEI